MIEVKDVSMMYGSFQALREVSFEATSGKILGLLGPNGAGKSTLMKIMTTFIHPTGGTVVINGHDVVNDPIAVRSVVGYLPETAPLYMDMRVDEYLAFVAGARGLEGTEREKRLDWVAEQCGIIKMKKHWIHELSKGYRQRVGLAQALVHDPQVLILDEPTSGLDPLQIIEIRKLVRELAKDKTIIFSTHILQEVTALSDQVVIINNGEIISNGTQDELSERAMRHRLHLISIKENKKKLEKKFDGLQGIANVRYVITDSEGFVTFELATKFEEKNIVKDINQLIQSESWQIKEFFEKKPNLEDSFISLLNEHNQSKQEAKIA